MKKFGLLLLLFATAIASGCASRSVWFAPSPSQVTPANFSRQSMAHALWIPPPGTTWQWQLGTPPAVRPIDDAQMYDIDMFDNDAAKVEQLHDTGSKVICYIDAGTWERFRPDANKFPKSVLGEPNGWPGERSLDI